MQSLALLHSHRVLGHSLTTRSSPSEPFSSLARGRRGADAGDLVDSMIEGRVVLEKIKLLESKMRYQIEKLVQLATADPSDEQVINGQPCHLTPSYGSWVLILEYCRPACVSPKSRSPHGWSLQRG